MAVAAIEDKGDVFPVRRDGRLKLLSVQAGDGYRMRIGGGWSRVAERPWDNGGMEDYNMNGSQALTNNFLLDGIPNVSVENPGPANLTLAVSQDATAEFKVQTNSYDAEYGRTGGGTVNITLKSGANVLFFDEPTNDLDVNTMRALEEAIENFAGCAVIVSHDRWFLDRLATHILAFEGDSRVEYFDGNYTQYEAYRREQLGLDSGPHRIKYRKLTR